MDTVAKNIKRLRKLNDMTQDQLAAKMFVTRQTISNWETGKVQPGIDTLNDLAAVFGTDINELIYGVPKGSYPKYQQRYVRSVIICAAVMIIAGFARASITPYLRQADISPVSGTIAAYLLPVVAESVIFFTFGMLIMSVFSLWFDLRVRKAAAAVISGAALLIPLLWYIAEFTVWILSPPFAATPLMRAVLLYPALRVLLICLCPFVSGVLVFLFHNRKRSV